VKSSFSVHSGAELDEWVVVTKVFAVVGNKAGLVNSATELFVFIGSIGLLPQSTRYE